MVYADLTKGRFSELGRAYSLTIVTENRIPHFMILPMQDVSLNKCKLCTMPSYYILLLGS